MFAQPIPHIDFDINLLGDCDTIVTALCQRAGWAFEHEMIDQRATISIAQHPDHEYAFTVKSSAAPSAVAAATVAGASAA
jgi:NAD-dependent histone deacetylase SIR2